MADDWQEIQSPSPYSRDLSERNLQLHVDFMAETVGKDPSQMSVAGGGLALGACVTDFMTSYCHELSGPYSSLSLTYDIQRKIKSGKIIPDLTDITSLLL